MAVFLTIESRVEAPLVPLRLFRHRNLRVANIVGVLWAAAMFALVLPLRALPAAGAPLQPAQVGLAFLPANLIMGRSRSGSLPRS